MLNLDKFWTNRARTLQNFKAGLGSACCSPNSKYFMSLFVWSNIITGLNYIYRWWPNICCVLKVFTTWIKSFGCIIPQSVGYNSMSLLMCGVVNVITINRWNCTSFIILVPVKQTGRMFLCHCQCLFQFSFLHFVIASLYGFVVMYSKDKFVCLFLYLCISLLVGWIICYGVV